MVARGPGYNRVRSRILIPRSGPLRFPIGCLPKVWIRSQKELFFVTSSFLKESKETESFKQSLGDKSLASGLEIRTLVVFRNSNRKRFNCLKSVNLPSNLFFLDLSQNITSSRGRYGSTAPGRSSQCNENRLRVRQRCNPVASLAFTQALKGHYATSSTCSSLGCPKPLSVRIRRHRRDTENAEIWSFACRGTTANEKSQPYRQRLRLFPGMAGFFCPSPSPDGQKRKNPLRLRGE